jgi:EF hand
MIAKFLTLTAFAFLIASIGASAQEQQPASGMMPGQGMMGQGMMGMMGRGMMDQGMMDQGMMGHGMGMRIMMILMDTDGDGALSLDEVQAAHARIFKAIDADKNGKVTMEEMQVFFHGNSPKMDQ